jgi:hypothetical protein
MERPAGTASTAFACWIVAILGGVAFGVILYRVGAFGLFGSVALGVVLSLAVGPFVTATIGRPLPTPRGTLGVQEPTAKLARREQAGQPGRAYMANIS